MLLHRIAILVLSLIISMMVATLLLGAIKGFTMEGLAESTRDNCGLFLNSDGSKFTEAQVEACVVLEMKGHACAMSYAGEYDCSYDGAFDVPMHRQLIECVANNPLVAQRVFACFEALRLEGK